MSKLVKRNNSFEKNIVVELLIHILSFLPHDYFWICEIVCKYWLKSLKNNIAKKILLSFIPKQMLYHNCLNLNFTPKKLIKIKNYIYAFTLGKICKIDTKNSDSVVNETNYIFFNFVSSNENYIVSISVYNSIKIYSPNMNLIDDILLGDIARGMTIDDDNNIYVTTYNKFYVYNINGKLICSWNLVDNSKRKHRSRQIRFHKNKIYMVDSSFNRLLIFSPKGKLIKSIGKLGSEHGNFKNPWGITVYKDIIFVVDTGNYRIQAFTCYGKFIFEYIHKGFIDMADIVIENNYAYINDWGSDYIKKFKLIYD
jgi:hypothetical protein